MTTATSRSRWRSQAGWRDPAVLAVVALSAALHLWDLGRRPLAHDEAIDAWFSWQARGWGVMRYDPVYHGPLRFYLEGLILRWVGTGPAEARLLAALCGIAATAVISTRARLLGRFGAPAAALLFTISPTVLTVTRTGREDSLTALLALGMLVLVADALTTPRPAHLIGLGALLAASWTVKETTFLFGFAAAIFFLAGLLAAWLRPASSARRAVARLAAVDRVAWTWSLVAFAAVFMVVFTSGFRYGPGLEAGLLDGLRYWWSQHDVGRGGQPWFFHLVVYASYEWLLLSLAGVGAVVAVRRRSLPGIWLLWMTVAQVVLYSWAGEKFAWLAVHPLVPAVLLAGIGAEAIVGAVVAASRPTVRAVAGLVAAVLVAATTVVAIRPAITHGADPRELLVTVQTSVDVPPVAAELRAAIESGTIDSVVVDASGGGSWPWVWYLHGLEGVSYPVLDPSEPLPPADVVIALAYGSAPPLVDGADVQRIRLREWWVPDYAAMGLGDYLRWFLTRATWSPTASSDQFVIRRAASSSATQG